MHIACWTGNMEIIQFLVDNGASVSAPNSHGQTPIHIAALRGRLEFLCNQ